MKNILQNKFITYSFLAASLLSTIGITSYMYLNRVTADNTVQSIQSNEPTFTLDEIAQYDGTDPSKPIYLAYEGNVYDVTAGSNYYKPGGSYHYLVGRDSTAELNQFGGDLIKEKYQIIGTINN